MSDYCEIPEFYSCSWPVARKEHRCVECGAPIFVGEKYGCFSGKWAHEPGVVTYRQHLHCEEACRELRDVLLGDCIAFGELFDVEHDFRSKNEKNRERNFRSIIARVKWRAKKKRPLTFLPPLEIKNQDLINDRKRGWA